VFFCICPSTNFASQEIIDSAVNRVAKTINESNALLLGRIERLVASLAPGTDQSKPTSGPSRFKGLRKPQANPVPDVQAYGPRMRHKDDVVLSVSAALSAPLFIPLKLILLNVI